MNMDNINKWLTLLTNFGVIAGIVFLGIEIKQNSVINQVDSIQSIRQSMNNINLLTMESSSFASLNLRMRNGEKLNPVENQQLRGLVFYMIIQSETAYAQYKHGLISEADLLELLMPIRASVTAHDSIAEIWTGYASYANSEFVDYMNKTIF